MPIRAGGVVRDPDGPGISSERVETDVCVTDLRDEELVAASPDDRDSDALPDHTGTRQIQFSLDFGF
jgi:hypothetical protein